MIDDTRASIAVNIVVFFATIALGFFLYVVLEPAATGLLDQAALNTETQAATDGQQYVRYAWQNIHFIVVVIGAAQLLTAAVFQRRGVAA